MGDKMTEAKRTWAQVEAEWHALGKLHDFEREEYHEWRREFYKHLAAGGSADDTMPAGRRALAQEKRDG